MIYIVLNLVPILAATAAGLLIGIIWLRLSPTLLPGVQTLILAGIAEFWLASILAGALILAPPEAGVWAMALGSAFVIWIGFVLPVLAVTFHVYRMARSSMISAAAHWLVVMLAQAGIMQAIGLVAPPGA
ncbi:hypothetical protein [Erythrobacter sp. THAF29]|uniref:hypothetical protein n=1 Tax=Erythrobacter sp. THAF29 TaxID=2587851 RepID=UPI001267E1BA|nr:hypothetical protein [Erythrobacter sp. THAF29]QFT77098.1 hypothetical protein FIU90_06045 [Erythrobacter sp. THAF29]